MSRQHNRREFLRTTALAGVGFWVAGPARADEGSRSAIDEINFASIRLDTNLIVRASTASPRDGAS